MVFPVRDDREDGYVPIVTYTIIILNLLIFMWDREWRLFGEPIVFAGLTAMPAELTGAISGKEWFPVVTMLTSMFLHGTLVHLIGNMLFLLVFGGGVESAFGPIRFMLYYLFWGFAACAAHVFVDPNSINYVLGASGAIGGVLGCYFLLYPASKIEVLLLGFPKTVYAWILLGIWFLYQILVPQIGVANWAHAGGFLVGMLTVLVAGGRQRILNEQRAGSSLNPRPVDYLG
jgi:membrane associated rhomboid family serine protease